MSSVETQQEKKQEQTREKERYFSHSLVEIRRFKYIPFFCHSAVLLDMSLGGFKIEFTGETVCRPGDQYWLIIHLPPLGIYAPKRIICRVECRWFDDTRYRMGGTFISLNKLEGMILEQVIESLKNKEQMLA
ncbi:MAG: PilZ domain-containing protein [Oligoflexales bacterium]|nr:PilZ domain-containing protein [Oligoflexales bacterium]